MSLMLTYNLENNECRLSNNRLLLVILVIRSFQTIGFSIHYGFRTLPCPLILSPSSPVKINYSLFMSYLVSAKSLKINAYAIFACSFCFSDVIRNSDFRRVCGRLVFMIQQ